YLTSLRSSLYLLPDGFSYSTFCFWSKYMKLIPSRRMASLAAAVNLVACLSLAAAPARATDQKDLAIGLKTLPLMENKITGAAVAAIVFDPANAASKADADAIKAA